MRTQVNSTIQAGVLEAAGADAQSPPEHAHLAHSVLGSLCYQIIAPTQGSGQANFLLWPQALLYNRLPFDVNFCLEGDAETSGGGTLCCACFT